MRHKISAVEDESIASELEVLPGDFLLSVDGKSIIDVLDYRFCIKSENLVVEIERFDGEVWELCIEKDFDEDLGLIFESPLMSKIKLCKNNCIFCFVDQEPIGLRKSLYVKDDDWRLSFLHGNFVTLTNVTESEAKRIAGLHLSPLYISVHAADESVRRKMMNLSGEDKLFRYLHMFGNAGIKMHFQIVLCKGINDGEVLEDTLEKLREIKGTESVALVPAGLTKHRQSLYPILPYTSLEAKLLINRIKSMEYFAKDCFEIYFSDEWYLLGDISFPSYRKYNDFPQLSNGVGLLRLFEHNFKTSLRNLTKSCIAKSIYIATGTLAEALMRRLAYLFCKKFTKVRVSVIAIKNNFYGDSVTVSGLLTGSDIINQLKDKLVCDVLYLPESSFRIGTEEMIDGTTRKQVEENLNVRVRIGSQDGGDFVNQLYEELLC